MKKHIIIYPTVALAFLSAGAQTLSEEVVIDRDITPVERPVVRPSWLMPALLTPGIEKTRLSFKEYMDAAEITRSISPLEPVAWGDSVMRSPYAGYASIGYFPTYNLDVSAGYRFIRRKNLNVGAHLSYDGSTWGGYSDATSRYSRNKIAVGADVTAVFAPGTLKADLHYSWSATATAQYPHLYHRGTQALNNVALDLSWTPSHIGRFGWDIKGNFGFGGFSSEKTDNLQGLLSLTNVRFKPLSDITFGITSDLSLRLGSTVDFVVGLGADVRHVSDFRYVDPVAYTELGGVYEKLGVEAVSAGSRTLGIFTVRPGFKFASSKFNGRVGLRVDFNSGGWQKDTHVAPEVDLNWAANNFFALRLQATGREVMNTNTQLWERNPWMTGTLACERSHINADIQLNAVFGSYKGFWAVLNGGLSSVSNWVSPVLLERVNIWARMNEFTGFNYGLELGYAWRDKLVVTGHAKGVSHGKYYRWQDNASWAFDIAAKVSPIENLQIDLGYEVRIDRRGYVLSPVIVEAEPAFFATTSSLGDTSNLFVGANYRITPQLSAFLKGENLLNHHWFITSNIRSQGIHGLAGVQYLF